MELGGSLFSSVSWLEFFGPTCVVVDVVDVVGMVEVIVLELVVGVVEVDGLGAETDT
jgi:hypothetical protein